MNDVIQLSELGEIITGNTPSTSNNANYESDDIIFVKPSDISNDRISYIENTENYISNYAKEKARVVPSDTVFCTCIGIIGKVGIATKDSAFNQQINAVIPDKEKVTSDYLAYALMAKRNYMQAKANAAVVPIINKSQFAGIKIKYVSLEEQKSITDKFQLLDSLIAKQEKQIEIIENLVKSRFVEMFGDPLDKQKVNAKFTECILFNPKKSEISDNMDMDVSFVPMECVGVNGSFAIKEDGKVADYYKGYTYFRDGDVLLAKITPCFENGKVTIANGCTNGIGFGTTEFHVFRPLEGGSTSEWIMYVLKNDNVHAQATINMTGSAGQKRIQTPFFEKLKVYLPPISEQEKFAEFVHQVDKSKLAIQQSLEMLQMLKAKLMQDYFG